MFPPTIELTITKVVDFIMFHIFDAVWMGCVTVELFKQIFVALKRIILYDEKSRIVIKKGIICYEIF